MSLRGTDKIFTPQSIEVTRLRYHLADGDGIELARKKAGINQQQHTMLLKIPWYSEIISRHKESKLSQSAIDILNRRLEAEKSNP